MRGACEGQWTRRSEQEPAGLPRGAMSPLVREQPNENADAPAGFRGRIRVRLSVQKLDFAGVGLVESAYYP